MRTCRSCLRRVALLESLSPRIETISADRRGARADELLGLDDRDLCLAALPRTEALRELRAAGEVTVLEDLEERIEAAGLWGVCRCSTAYPESLRESASPPACLFGAGNLAALEQCAGHRAVTIVGARRAGDYGRTVAYELARDVASAGLTVISGLALGVDACAHRGALDASGLTIAVLGGGADVPTPRRNARLAAEISVSGALISELAPGQTPRRWCFPARNRIMAALVELTVVVVAAERSGSLITARIARDLGRNVGAVPGPVNSGICAGTNALIADGAAVVRGARDILDLLLGAGAGSFEPTGPPVEPDGRIILEVVERGHSLPDRIAADLGWEAQRVARALASLEVGGYLRRRGIGGGLTRTNLRVARPG